MTPAATPMRGRFRDGGQANDERRALPVRIVVANDLAAMLAHDAIADAQAQARSLAHFLGGEEWIEDAVGIGDAVAVVAERDFDKFAAAERFMISMRAGRPVSRTAS